MAFDLQPLASSFRREVGLRPKGPLSLSPGHRPGIGGGRSIPRRPEGPRQERITRGRGAPASQRGASRFPAAPRGDGDLPRREDPPPPPRGSGMGLAFSSWGSRRQATCLRPSRGNPSERAFQAAYEHQYPVEFGKTWPQVLGLGLVVVPQALQSQ